LGKPFKVIQVGFGPMGQIVTKLLLKRKNIDLVGVIDIAKEFQEKKITDILSTDIDSDLVITSDLERILTKDIDVVIIATSSFFEKITPMILEVVGKGVNVISLCEQLAYPFDFHPELSKKVDAAAKKRNATVVGTGINPGYLMELLPIMLTAPCEAVEKITITRMMNSSKRRIPFQVKIGTGLNKEKFEKKISEKKITGHVGLEESMQMINAALSLELDEFIELPPVAMIAEKPFVYDNIEVPKGHVCGLHSQGIAKKDGKEILKLDFIAYSGDHEEYDSVEIIGIPNIKQIIKGGVHGDIGTASMVVNLIPKVVKANAGLLTMIDLPVPCNTANIWKE